MDWDSLKNIFSYHAPNKEQEEKYKELRLRGLALADTINILCPDSREKSSAITKAQEAVMWANASIAINEPHTD